jgi:DNA-binding NtrC family response regulator
VVTIHLPALRERGDDLRLLTEHFVRRFATELRKDIPAIAPETHAQILAYPWPGNIRELQSAIKQALLYATGPVLIPDFLPPAVRGQATAAPEPQRSPDTLSPWDQFLEKQLAAGGENLYPEWLAMTEQHLLSRVIQFTGGNLSHASRILGINRRTLRIKLHALGIAVAGD